VDAAVLLYASPGPCVLGGAARYGRGLPGIPVMSCLILVDFLGEVVLGYWLLCQQMKIAMEWYMRIQQKSLLLLKKKSSNVALECKNNLGPVAAVQIRT
jgi:hypothetical protein